MPADQVSSTLQDSVPSKGKISGFLASLHPQHNRHEFHDKATNFSASYKAWSQSTANTPESDRTKLREKSVQDRRLFLKKYRDYHTWGSSKVRGFVLPEAYLGSTDAVTDGHLKSAAREAEMISSMARDRQPSHEAVAEQTRIWATSIYADDSLCAK